MFLSIFPEYWNLKRRCISKQASKSENASGNATGNASDIGSPHDFVWVQTHVFITPWISTHSPQNSIFVVTRPMPPPNPKARQLHASRRPDIRVWQNLHPCLPHIFSHNRMTNKLFPQNIASSPKCQNPSILPQGLYIETSYPTDRPGRLRVSARQCLTEKKMEPWM